MLKIKHILTFIFVVLIFGCNGSNQVRISIKGSDTMLNLTQLAAEKYMEENKNVSISLSGGGSGTGIAALINRTAHIANISRTLKESEKKKIAELQNRIKKVSIGQDGVAVIVNSSNSIDSLTVSQLKMIYSGEITNWLQLGGKDEEIILYSRETSSGTYDFFKNKVLTYNSNNNYTDFSTKIQLLQGTAAVVQAVASDLNGIGYGGVGYFKNRDDVKILRIAENNLKSAIAPIIGGKINLAAINDNSYFLSRELYCYINEDAEEEITNFISFLLSESGQKIIEDSGFIPLKNKNE